MALILVKGSVDCLLSAIARVRTNGLSVAISRVMTILPPHEPRIYSPVCFRDSSPGGAQQLLSIALFHDMYDRIPLADASLITLSQTYIDDPMISVFAKNHALERIVLNAMIPRTRDRKLGVAHIEYIESMPYPPSCSTSEAKGEDVEGFTPIDAHCYACGAKPESYTENRHHLVSGSRACLGCCNSKFSWERSVVVCHRDALLSLCARFLREQMESKFSVDIVLYPVEIQLVFLIGSGFYISQLPIAPAVYSKFYAGRRRLRITKKVARDLFAPTARHREKDTDAARQRAFDEMMADARPRDAPAASAAPAAP